MNMNQGPLYHPELVVLDTPDAVAVEVSERILRFITSEDRTVLGLATGRTPLAVYARLAEAYRAGTSFADVESFNLDEYLGLAPDDPGSFARYMRQNLFDHVDMKPQRGHVPSGLGDPDQVARGFEEAITRAGGIGLQMLGIGRNGHIGFNEPGSAFDCRTRVVSLDDSTRSDNAADFPEGTEVPRDAITMGIGTILEARKILLVATGEAKSEALAVAFNATPSPECPASALQFHPRVTLVCDQAAAKHLWSR